MSKRFHAQMTQIEDKSKRQVTYNKRKKGFLKKAIEFSQLCELQIHITILDKKKCKLVQFKSHEDFDLAYIQKILQDDIKCEFYNNDNYDQLIDMNYQKKAREQTKKAKFDLVQ